jgi:hypothetical protein
MEPIKETNRVAWTDNLPHRAFPEDHGTARDLALLATLGLGLSVADARCCSHSAPRCNLPEKDGSASYVSDSPSNIES